MGLVCELDIEVWERFDAMADEALDNLSAGRCMER